MDYVAPAILFVLGFGAAYVLGVGRQWRRDGGGLSNLPLRNGVVRLDLLVRGSRGRGRSTDVAENGAGRQQTSASGDLAAPIAVGQGPRKRSGARKRR